MLGYVAIASRIFKPEVAAASFRLDALAKASRKLGFETRVLTVKPVEPVDDGDEDIRRFPVLRDSEGYVKGYLQYMSFDIPLFFRLLLTQPRPDVVVSEPPPTTGAVTRMAGIIRRFPYVYYAADIWSDATESMDTASWVTTVLRSVERFALRGASAVIAVSPEVAERVQEISGRGAHVVRNGIDLDIFNIDGPQISDEELESHGVSKRYLLYSGTMSTWQGAQIFIDALASKALKDTDVDLVFMGRGDDVDRLKEHAARKAPGRVHFFGPSAPEVSAKWQRKASGGLVSVDPESGYDFAYPTKFLASLACGTPVIYAGPGPARAEIEKYDLGVACPWDAEVVGEKVAELLDRPKDSKRLFEWIKENRSMSATGAAAAEIVRSVKRG